MFFRRKRLQPVASTAPASQAAVAIEDDEQPTGGVPAPSEVKFSEEDALISEWLATAKELGITAGKVPETELCLFLRAEGIPIYKSQAVFDYLTAEAKKAKTTWKFQPLREIDSERAKTGPTWASVEEWPAGHGDMGPIYRSRVPLPVLLTVKKIVAKFGSSATFYVAAIDDDPFLAVRLHDSNLVFVERWDEPGFRQ